MSIAIAIKHMMAAGMPPDAIVAAVAEMEATKPSVVRTARQERNARYYEARKERLKASEKRLNETEASEIAPPPERPSEINLLPSEVNQNLLPKKPPKGGQKRVPDGEQALSDCGVSESLISDWKAVRQAKRAGPITATVAESLIREAALAGLSPSDAVRTAVERGWQCFRHGWMHSEHSTGPPHRQAIPTAGERAEQIRSFIERAENEQSPSHRAPFVLLAGTAR